MTTDETKERIRGLACWQGSVDPQPLEGGITNLNYRVSDQGRDYVVRLGEDIPAHGVLRFNELAISRAAATVGLSPAVRHAEPGVMVLDHVDAKPLDAADLSDRQTLTDVLALLERVHRDVTNAVVGPVLTFWVFHVIRDYARTLRSLHSPYRHHLDGLVQEAVLLEVQVGAIQPVVAHNDLLPANILRGEDRLWLIDWEYGGFNSPLFDLGGLASNAALDVDTERWMLDSWFDGEPPLRAFEAMKCASLLRETLWSMVSERTSTIDFDYAAYTAEYLERYRAAFSRLRGGLTT